MWQVLQVYGVDEWLLKAVSNFYMQSRACVTVDREDREYFPEQVGLCQMCDVTVPI